MQLDKHARTHTHTHACTHTNTHTHTCTHTNTHTHTHTHTNQHHGSHTAVCQGLCGRWVGMCGLCTHRRHWPCVLVLSVSRYVALECVCVVQSHCTARVREKVRIFSLTICTHEASHTHTTMDASPTVPSRGCHSGSRRCGNNQ